MPTSAERDDVDAIVQLTVDYCWAIDEQNFDGLRRIFTSDAEAQMVGTDRRGIDEIIDFVRGVLTPLDASQHMLTNHAVVVDGDRATGRCYFHAQHIRRAAEGGRNLVIGGRYDDEFVRTVDGWRISRRTAAAMWREGNPAVIDRSA